MKKVLFYSDTPTYGGHEQMFLNFITSQDFNDCEFFLLHSIHNHKLSEKVAVHSRSFKKVFTFRHMSKSFNGIRNFFSFKAKQEIIDVIDETKPDVIVLIQGMIELSSLPVILNRSFKVVSYIPQVLPLSQTGAKLGALRDFLNKYYYSSLDKVITISPDNASVCRERWGVADDKLAIVNNGIDVEHQTVKYEEHSKFRFLCLGRFDLHCKRQDLLITTFISRFQDCSNTELHIVGTGDEQSTELLKSLAADADNVFISPWVEDSLSLIDNFDALVINSAFEGVPLVALEAMSKGVPVISTDLPYCTMFQDLEEFHIVSRENILEDALQHLVSQGKRKFPLLKQRIIDDFSLKSNSLKFVQEILG